MLRIWEIGIGDAIGCVGLSVGPLGPNHKDHIFLLPQLEVHISFFAWVTHKNIPMVRIKTQSTFPGI